MAGEAILGELPRSWELTTLGEVCRRDGGDIQTGPFGSQLHASDYVPFGIPSALSDKPLSLRGQGHEALGELDDYWWQPPGGGNLR